MIDTVIIDGVERPASEAHPTTHRLLGWFRYPNPPVVHTFSTCPRCGCGFDPETTYFSAKCWLDGHFDVPQYESLVPPPRVMHIPDSDCAIVDSHLESQCGWSKMARRI